MDTDAAAAAGPSDPEGVLAGQLMEWVRAQAKALPERIRQKLVTQEGAARQCSEQMLAWVEEHITSHASEAAQPEPLRVGLCMLTVTRLVTPHASWHGQKGALPCYSALACPARPHAERNVHLKRRWRAMCVQVVARALLSVADKSPSHMHTCFERYAAALHGLISQHDEAAAQMGAGMVSPGQLALLEVRTASCVHAARCTSAAHMPLQAVAVRRCKMLLQ